MILKSDVDIEKHGILGVVRVINQAKIFLTIALVLGLAVGLFLAKTTPRVYQASASFISASQLTNGGSSMASLSSAASRLGLDLGGNDSDLSPLFPWILDSQELSTQILFSKFSNSNGTSLLLLDVLVSDHPDSLQRIHEGLDLLKNKVMRHRFDKVSGVTTLNVVLEDPVMAKEVANAFVTLLDQFNQQAKKTQARELVLFLTTRLAQIEEEFRTSEVAMRDFRLANRNIQGSPQLMLEEARLLRQQQLTQELYLSLKTQLEVVRLDAIKDLPLIAIIDPAFVPFQAFAPRPVRLVAMSGIMGWALGLIFVFFWNQLLVLKKRTQEDEHLVADHS
ncbi:MAG: hypothetical protein GY780_08880 [bacterium]|nr:hypothetical protein [bacterium]